MKNVFSEIFLFFMVLALPFAGKGQNLIENPSFEDTAGYDFDQRMLLDDLKNWDYCANPIHWFNHKYTDNVPSNRHGFQYPKHGLGYSTFFAASSISKDYRFLLDFIQGKLKKSLKANRPYTLRFFVSLASNSEDNHPTFAISNMDVLFTKENYCIDTQRIYEIRDSTFKYNKLEKEPQVQNPRDRVLADTAGWMEVKGTFRAEGGEMHFLIGAFDDSSEFRHEMVDTSGNRGASAYYYMDHFSLKPLPALDVPKDTFVLCDKAPKPLYPFPEDTLHRWHNGSTRDTLMATQTGLYAARLSNFDTTLADSIMVYRLPDLNLGPDTSLCPGQTLTMQPNLPGNLDYQWDDGSTKHQRTVEEPGIYWVAVSNDSCTVRDTIRVKETGIQVNLGPDTTICQGKSYTLKVPDSMNAQWSTGATTSQITVEAAGKYWVQGDNGFCTASDTVQVQYQNPPDAKIPEDTSFCKGDTFKLSYEQDWTLLKNRQEVANPITFTEPGRYNVRIENRCGAVNETLELKQNDCPCLVRFPNAFTPDDNDLNESFRPEHECRFREFRLTIYNRWGERIYETHRPEEGWSPNKDVPQGLYLWKAVYTGYEEGFNRTFMKTGQVKLLR